MIRRQLSKYCSVLSDWVQASGEWPGHDILSTGVPGETLEPRFLWAPGEHRESIHSHPAVDSYVSGKLIKVLDVLPRSAQTCACAI